MAHCHLYRSGAAGGGWPARGAPRTAGPIQALRVGQGRTPITCQQAAQQRDVEPVQRDDTSVFSSTPEAALLLQGRKDRQQQDAELPVSRQEDPEAAALSVGTPETKRHSSTAAAPILSGSGGGIFFFWQLGVVKYLQQHFDLSNVQLRGASAGGLVACLCACNVDPERAVRLAYEIALENKIFDRRLGLLGIWGGLVRRWLDELLPANAAELCRGRLKLVVTDTVDFRLAYLDCWTTREELIDACMASAHVPFFLDLRFSATYRGGSYVDGSLQDFIKWENSELLRCGGRAFLLDYSEDEQLQFSRLDFLKLRSYEEVHKLIEAGYAFAARRDTAGALERHFGALPYGGRLGTPQAGLHQ